MEFTTVLPKAKRTFSVMTGIDCVIMGLVVSRSMRTASLEKLNAPSPARLFLTANTSITACDASDATAIITRPLWRI